MRQNDDIIKRGKLWDVGLLPISDAAGELTLNMCGKIKLKDSKTSTVVWTAGEHFEHVSISPVHKYTMPTWDDMCELKDIFFYETEEAYQVHPPKNEYINAVENCLHLWRLTNGARITDIAGGTFGMKKEWQCSNCGKRFKLSDDAYEMFDAGCRATGVPYCPECVKTWKERNGEEFDDEYEKPERLFVTWYCDYIKRR